MEGSGAATSQMEGTAGRNEFGKSGGKGKYLPLSGPQFPQLYKGRIISL